MSEEQGPRPPARAPEQPVTEFLDVFVTWLATDVRPAISARTERLRELVPRIEGGHEIEVVIANLDDLLVRLDAVAVSIADRPMASRAEEVESLAAAAAERCDDARALMARARMALAGRPARTSGGSCVRAPTDAGPGHAETVTLSGGATTS